MSFREILVHVPSFRAWPKHVGYAARFAAHFDAHLTGLFALEPYATTDVLGAPSVANALHQQIERELSDAHAAGVAFAEHVQTLGVNRSEWKIAEGEVPRVLTYAGAWHDLLVLGPARESFRSSPSLVAQCLVDSNMPCLVVPEGAVDKPMALGTIAVAWNGSIEAMRAIHSALPLLAQARRVVVLWGHQRDYLTWMPRLPSFDLDMYLSRHDIKIERRNVETSDADAGIAVFDQAEKEKADLVVMGAYGRSRFSEWVLGGATRYALWDGRIPLFLRH
jgi:nucleotide-binding universal stress UspA family protein